MPESLACVSSNNRGKLLELTTVEIALGVAVIPILLGLRWFYVTTQPWNSDEPQHLHVVWAWANGLLPYKDVFDNHSPLFQAMSAPLFRLLGERADIVIAMRWAMLPIAVLLIGTTYWIGARLFSVRAGFWGALLAASFSDLYAKLGEYRPDLFWAALWLVSLAILIGGKMTPGRLFAVGFVFGVAFSVSMKTTFLLLDTVAAGSVAWLIRTGKEPVEYSEPKPNVAACVFAAIIGGLIVPILIIGFFAFKGALSQMYYCVVAHNLTSVENPWHLMIAKIKDLRFWLFVPAIAGGLWLANPDDESLGTAGLLQRIFAKKVAVRILYATNGDNNPWAQRYWERRWRIGSTERIRWGRRRCEEALAAITVLGGERDSAKFMNLPDLGTTALLMEGSSELSLADEIQDWQPTVALIPAMFDAHPDHNALLVWRPAGKPVCAAGILHRVIPSLEAKFDERGPGNCSCNHPCLL